MAPIKVKNYSKLFYQTNYKDKLNFGKTLWSSGKAEDS